MSHPRAALRGLKVAISLRNFAFCQAPASAAAAIARGERQLKLK
jgi:hypothetical protein